MDISANEFRTSDEVKSTLGNGSYPGNGEKWTFHFDLTEQNAFHF